MRQFWKILAILALTSQITACGKNQKDVYKGLEAPTIYQMGEQHLAKKNYGRAVKDFDALEARYPYGDYADKAQIKLIYSYYKANEPLSALANADRFIRMQPNHPEIDYVHYLKGLINYQQNQTFLFRHLPLDRSSREPLTARESLAQFKEVVERYPQSKYVTEAKKYIDILTEQLATHELHVTQYYFNREAHLACINRARALIEDYPKTPAAPQALHLMIKSYEALHMKDEAARARKLLNKDYPASL